MFRNILRMLSIVVLSSFALVSYADEKLRGTWIVVAAEYDGAEAKCDLKPGEKLIFDGKKFKFESKRYHEEGTFATEGEKKTREINLVNTKDKKTEGIYEVKGEEMELCYCELRRPTEFKSAKGVMLIKLKR